MVALAGFWPTPRARFQWRADSARDGPCRGPSTAYRVWNQRDYLGLRSCASVAGREESATEGRPPITRLNRAISSSGLCSRRAAERLITEGVVTVNGVKVDRLATFVELSDQVCVNGKQIWRSQIPRYYFAMNKPKGYICSAKALYEHERTAISLMNDWLEQWDKDNPERPTPRLFTVGRLDAQSVGLIFVTNDGDWASKMIHPSAGLTKEYNVTLTRRPLPSEMRKLAQSVEVEPGVKVAPVSVSLDEASVRGSARVRIILSEGRTHEVRKMVAAAGLTIKSLRRTRIGPYRLDNDVPFGAFVELSHDEAWEVVNQT